jgi:hypothetical protein
MVSTFFLGDLRKEVERLGEMKRNLGEGNDRNTDTIRLESANRKKITEAIQIWNVLKEQYVKDQKKVEGGKLKDIDEAEMSDRKKILGILYNEVQDLTKKNGRVKPLISSAEDQEHQSRRETRNAKKREERERRKNRRKGNKGEPEEDEPEPIPLTEQEVKFHEQVEGNVAEQDELLDEISKGMDELKALGLDMNKSLTLQNKMLDVIEEKVDQNIRKLVSANARMKDIMEKSGGMTQWCPRILCLVILVALVVYMFKLV